MALSDHIKKDSPTNNFATLNPIASHINAVTTDQLEDGNLVVLTKGVSGVTANIGISSMYFPREGKWYFEILLRAGSDPHIWSGIQNESHTRYITYYFDKIYYFDSSGNLTFTTISNSTSVGDVHGFLVDFDTGSFTTYNNGTANNSVSFNHYNDEKFYIYIDDGSSAHQTSQVLNAGQDHLFGGATLPSGASASGNSPDNGIGLFAYTVPTGAKALCTANLPDFTPTVDDDNPENYFKCVTWIGDTQASRTHTVGFPADLVWVKNRDYANPHNLFDSVRGFGSASAGNNLQTDQTLPQNYYGTYGYVSSVTSTEITFNSGTTDNAYVNRNGNKMVAWCFRAGGAPTEDNTVAASTGNAMTSTDANNSSVSLDGVLQSSYTPSGSPTIYPKRMSIGTKQGFSIIKYSGTGSAASVPHGLSGLDFLIVKAVTTGSSGDTNWRVYHKSLGATKNLKLNSVAAGETDTSRWNDTEPTSTVFSLGNHASTNATGYTYIAYCFTSIEGYSKFGSYTGVVSGKPFIHLGFKPALVMIKGVDDNGYNSYQGWSMFDTTRNGHNPANTTLYANASYVEGVAGNGSGTVGGIDILSNGFRLLDGSASYSGIANIKHIYMAWAEQPFKFANAR